MASRVVNRVAWVVGGICIGVLAGMMMRGFLYTDVPTKARAYPPQIGSVSTGTSSLIDGGQSTTSTNAMDMIAVSIPLSREVFAQTEAIAASSTWHVAKGTRVLLVPHHLVAAAGIASLIHVTPRPSKIFLIAPDHFSQGKTVFTTTDTNFRTSEGIVAGSKDDAARISRDVSAVRLAREPFITEHGVYGLLPFIAHEWPGVHVIPIIIRLDAGVQDRERMAQSLVNALQEDQNAIVLASVDFSHDQTEAVADAHDTLALDVVRGLADRETDRVELDSPGALAIALRVARELGLGDVTIQSHTNSLRLLQAKQAQESTSHILASFAPGPITPQRVTTMLFVGDMMFDRTVATRIRASKSLMYAFEKIQGAEGRFFRGYDAVIGNLEGPVTTKRALPEKEIDFAFDPSVLSAIKRVGFDALSQANNHQLDQGRAGADTSRKAITDAGLTAFGDEVHEDATSSLAFIERRGQRIALIGFNTTDNPLDEAAAKATIATAKTHADRVIVFMHWGEEYHDTPNATQKALAHEFIDEGVDAVIGSHPHWMQSVEVYRGKVIAYSLGNFIFDQDWSAETREGLAVSLSLSPSGSHLALFPIRIEQSQPVLLTGADRQKRLEKLASISDVSLREQILSGVIQTEQ